MTTRRSGHVLSMTRIKYYPWATTGCRPAAMTMTCRGSREGEPLDTKYFYVCHAELNAILNYGGGSLYGARVYVTLFPCNECAKAIIQSGMKEVIYMQDKYADDDMTVASKRMFDMAGVKYRKFEPKDQTIELHL